MRKMLLITVITTIMLTSCSFGAPAAPTVDPIVAALEATIAVQNAASTMMAEQAMKTQEAIPVTGATTEVPTVEPTATTAPTEVQAVRVTATTNANCRLGPYSNFAVAGVLKMGESADVIGQNTVNGQWWKVKLSSGVECWIFGNLVTVSGDTSTVAMLVSPATPTPVPPPDWNGTWTIQMARDFSNTEDLKTTYTVNMVQSGNQLTYSFSLSPYTFHAALTVSADGMSASGILYRSDGNSWSLKFVRNPDNLNQFRGKWYWSSDQQHDGDNCGYKAGAGIPIPCRP
jgi:uncharacterized protein YgiM (DUF1202 family)